MWVHSEQSFAWCLERIFGDCLISTVRPAGPILSVFPALIVHSELKSVHPGFPVAFIFSAQVN